MTDRTPLDDLTSDALDALYERAEQAEAAIERVRAWITGEPVTARSEFGSGYREALRDITDALDEQPTEATVTIPATRHTELTAGQCTHYLGIHQQHHSQPVDGCPYPGCLPQPPDSP